VLLLVAVSVTVFIAFMNWLSSLSLQPARKLSAVEENFVDDATAQTRTYAEGQGYPKYARAAKALSVALLVVPALAVLITALANSRLQSPYDAGTLSAVGWHVLIVEPGAFVVPAMFAAVLVVLTLHGFVLMALPRYAEIHAWSAFTWARASYSIQDYLRPLVASGRLSPATRFDPGLFLRGIAKTGETSIALAAAALTFVTAILLHHDQSRYALLTDDYIEVMEYWTLTRHRYSYDQVQRVDMSCDDRDAEYELVLPDGFSVDVLYRSSLGRRFRDVQRVEQKTNGVARNLPPMSRTDFPMCVEDIVRDWDEEDATAAKEIFRLEAWQRQRWIERSGQAERR
jgi:hypothetical protein